jgi:hypothetical protein
MGHWHTLHLFNDKVFYQDIVPKLKNQDYDLKHEYLEYMRLNSIENINEEDELNIKLNTLISEIRFHTNKMNEEFKIHSDYNSILDYENKRKYLSNYPILYDLGCFIEYMIFSRCADFYPHKSLRKSGLQGLQIEASKNSKTNEILSKLCNYETILIAEDYSGIANWITSEEVEFLYNSKNEIINLDVGFNNLIDKAFEYKLGLTVGVNMSVSNLFRSYKLTSRESWDNTSLFGLEVERFDKSYF